jgi:hypothetical protein
VVKIRHIIQFPSSVESNHGQKLLNIIDRRWKNPYENSNMSD